MARLPHVWATAFGIKKTQDKFTGESCYKVFVNKKLQEKKLEKRERVPKIVQRGGRKFYTDVVEIGALKLHWGASSTYGFALDADSKLGTLTGFGISNGDIYGISCAHVIWGSDRLIEPPDKIKMWHSQREEWIHIGAARSIIYERGKGYLPHFGFLDAGLFNIELNTLKKYAFSKTEQPYYDFSNVENIPALLQGKKIFGKGAISGETEGIISGVFMQDILGTGIKADLLIESFDGASLTQPGDSGMLWVDEEGKALGVHIMGENRGPNVPSRISLATFVHRIIDHFGIKLSI